MAASKGIIQQLNIVGRCRQYRVGLWQCPTFLFLIMGIIIIFAMTATYFIADHYASPEIVILLEAVITAVLFIIGHLIIQGFDGLAKLNSAMSDFISIASHQLRTPLTHLRWTVELLMEDNSAENANKRLEHLEYIRSNSKRMVMLVNDLLNVSRIERRSLTLTPANFQITEIIDTILADFETTAVAHNITLAKEIMPNLPEAFADGNKIHEVVQNLVDNAIRYTLDKGSVTIKTGVKNNRLLIWITDTGVGIPKDEQNKIFQKFFRSRNAMKYQTEGTGLGLFIARGIVHASNGQIGFVSQENHGTTFWFTLPLAKK